MRQRSGLFLLIMALFLVNGVYFLIGGCLLDESNHFKNKTQSVMYKTVPGLNISQQLIFNLLELRRIQLRLTIFAKHNQYTSLPEIKSVIDKNNILLEEYKELIETDKEEVILKQLINSWSDYVAVSSDALDLYYQGEKDKSLSLLLNDTMIYLKRFEKENEKLININNEYVLSFSQETTRFENKTSRVFYTGLIISLLIQFFFVATYCFLQRSKKRAIGEANIDPLTSLYNRRKVYSQWELFRKNSPTVVALCDIDYFKKINDTYGHNTGDFILIEISRILKKHAGKLDLVARVGGEEFVIIFYKKSLSDAAEIVERIRFEIESSSFSDKSKNVIKLTISFGLAENNSAIATFEEVLAQADERLYHSKNTGRNKVSY
ncbi:MAG: diguanylate cyclase [Plesiomonas sp.]|uniref:diguanylate cyclase n=1 Tax=Plesiomonas sp. TaxID=2486279 RepID=UPI003F380543